jgi:hypothetical protein
LIVYRLDLIDGGDGPLLWVEINGLVGPTAPDFAPPKTSA